MAGKLNARKVETLTKPGRCPDGGNLYLRIPPNGGKRWMFFYRLGYKPPAPEVFIPATARAAAPHQPTSPPALAPKPPMH